MVCLFGMNVQAEDVYTEFHVDNQKGKAGDVVTVPVEFNTGQEVGGFQISIYYDKEVLEFQEKVVGDLAVVSTDQNKSDRSKSDDKSDKKSDKDKDKSKSEKESSDDKKDSSESGEKGKGDSGKKDADKADKDKKSKKLSAEDFKALAAFFGVMILSGVVVYLIKKKNGNKQK